MKSYKRFLCLLLAGILALAVIPFASAADSGIIGSGTGEGGTYPIAELIYSFNAVGTLADYSNGERYFSLNNNLFSESGSRMERYCDMDGMIWAVFGETFALQKTDGTFEVFNIGEPTESLGVYDDIVVNNDGSFIGYRGAAKYLFISTESSNYRVAAYELGDIVYTYIGYGRYFCIEGYEPPEDMGDEGVGFDYILETIDLNTAKIFMFDSSSAARTYFENGTIIVAPNVIDGVHCAVRMGDNGKMELVSIDEKGNILYDGKYALLYELDDYYSAISSDCTESYLIDEDMKPVITLQNRVEGVREVVTGTYGPMTVVHEFSFVHGDYAGIGIFSGEEAAFDGDWEDLSVYSIKDKEQVACFDTGYGLSDDYACAYDDEGYAHIISERKITKTDYVYIEVPEDGDLFVGYYLDDSAVVLDEELQVMEGVSSKFGVRLYDDLAICYNAEGKAGLCSVDGRVLVDYGYTDAYFLFELENGSKVVEFYTVTGEDTAIADYYIINYSPMPFTDIKIKSEWFYDYVLHIVQSGLMVGVRDTEFAPNATMTRAQLVTVLWRLAGSKSAVYENSFTDVADGMWYTSPIAWAADNNIVLGFEGGEFKPDEGVTRDQLAAIMYRYTEYMGGDVSASGDLSSFPDAGEIQEWAVAPIKWAVATGLLAGKGNSEGAIMAPKALTTRAEVATVITRYEKLGK